MANEKKMKERAKELAEAHFEFLKEFAVEMRTPVDPDTMTLIGYIYKIAFVHGFKHGVQYEQRRST